MKTRFFTLLALAVSTLLSLTSCNEFKLDEHMLEAGKHVIAFTITNSYGDQISGTSEFTIQDKPNK